MKTRKTAKQVATIIWQNVLDWNARKIDFDTFDRTAKETWGYAASRSERFSRMVHDCLRALP